MPLALFLGGALCKANPLAIKFVPAVLLCRVETREVGGWWFKEGCRLTDACFELGEMLKEGRRRLTIILGGVAASCGLQLEYRRFGCVLRCLALLARVTFEGVS